MARSLVSSPLFWTTSALVALTIAWGCSSSSSSQGPGGGDGGGNDSSATSDGGSDSATVGDGGTGAHDGASPDALYGACAIQGSFGSPCTATTSGPDPSECTDPKYPQCFVGGQGGWCTKACASNADCTTGVSDAGCIPTSCNGRGFCK